MNILNRAIAYYLNKIGYLVIPKDAYELLDKSKVTFKNDLLWTYHAASFLEDQKFVESYKLGKGTDTGLLLKDYDIEWRMHVSLWAANYAKNLEGDFIECGVSTGMIPKAVINYLGNFNSLNKTYYLMDTFIGMDPRYSSEVEMDASRKIGYDKEDKYEMVKQTFQGFNVKIIKGAIPDTLTQIDSKKFCYVSIDMNSVIPEIEALKFLWDKIVPGGIIILDDHGYHNTTKAQENAQNEFAKSVGREVLYLPTSQGIIIK